MEKLRQTPSQTVGPLFAYGLTARQYGYDYSSFVDGLLVNDGSAGTQIRIWGRVFDGAGNIIPDAMIEFSQVDANGKYRQVPIQIENPGFVGFGRLGTGTTPDNHFSFTTVKPGSFNGHAPHIDIILFMRGSLKHLYTRLYFSDENNEADPLLQSADRNRRETLIAQRADINGNIEYQFDIHMQGEKETLFFEL